MHGRNVGALAAVCRVLADPDDSDHRDRGVRMVGARGGADPEDIDHGATGCGSGGGLAFACAGGAAGP